MLPASNADLHPLVRKLESIVALTDHEREAVLRIPVTVRTLRTDQDIVRDQDRPSQCCLILDGWAFRYKMLGVGKRQILSFHIPGDVPDLQSLRLEVMDHNLGTLTQAKVAFIPHEVMRAFIRAQPRLGDVFWRETLIDAAVFREWVTNVGRREAYGRIAHVFCELFVRMRAVGLSNGESYPMPITQAELADATGLSTVHVNRTMQELRGNGLISTKGGSVIIKDWDGLREAGEFDPTYLHQKKVAA